jgi:hypothetical protein
MVSLVVVVDDIVVFPVSVSLRRWRRVGRVVKMTHCMPALVDLMS